MSRLEQFLPAGDFDERGQPLRLRRARAAARGNGVDSHAQAWRGRLARGGACRRAARSIQLASARCAFRRVGRSPCDGRRGNDEASCRSDVVRSRLVQPGATGPREPVVADHGRPRCDRQSGGETMTLKHSALLAILCSCAATAFAQNVARLDVMTVAGHPVDGRNGGYRHVAQHCG